MPETSPACAPLPPPDFADIEAAAARLAGVAVMTPLLNAPALDARLGGQVLIKAETLQRTGSFKFRGAYNTIRQLPDSARDGGVVAFSSGNHAQGVAQAARLCGLPAVIVMPADAPDMKVANTRADGAEVQLYDRYFEDREAIAARLVTERGATLISPYDDPRIIAGQGTCGLEIARQSVAAGGPPDTVLICCGGGGLAAGSALALKHLAPSAEILAVEPEGFDDHRRSLAEGQRVTNPPGSRSICDALLAPTPGALTFEVNRRHLDGGIAVSDAEVRAAVAFAYRRLKLVVEPGGAVCLAALLAGKVATAGRRVAIVLSGGNVDPATFGEIIAETI